MQEKTDKVTLYGRIVGEVDYDRRGVVTLTLETSGKKYLDVRLVGNGLFDLSTLAKAGLNMKISATKKDTPRGGGYESEEIVIETPVISFALNNPRCSVSFYTKRKVS